MAKGEKRFSTSGHEVTKFDGFPPITPGDYRALIRADKAEVRKSKDEKSAQLPYVACMFTIRGTAMKEGGKDRVVFHNFFLSLEPTDKGQLMVTRADQLKGLSLGLGEEIDLPTRSFPNNLTQEDAECVDPKALVQWLKDNDGREVALHIKTDVAKPEALAKGWKDKDVISYFIEADAAADIESPADEDTDEDEDEDSDEETEDEAPAKPTKTKTKAPPAKPAKKGKK